MVMAAAVCMSPSQPDLGARAQPTEFLGRPRVLAVDDTPSNLIALEAVLSRDHDVLVASSGAEALELLERRQDIDVVLLDVQMPQMDGYEVAQRIKKLPGCEDIPIIFVTAIFMEDPHIKRGYEVGGVDYFTKPFDPNILRLKVNVYAAFRRRAAIAKARERQLRESEELLRVSRRLTSHLEDFPVGVIITDATGRICQRNEEVLRILKTTASLNAYGYGELLGWWDRDGEKLTDALTRALHSGTSSQHALAKFRCPDGTWKNLLVSTSPLYGINGQVVGAAIVLQDITERKKFEIDFEERINKLVSYGLGVEQSTARTPS